jgi:hypothetical protein
VRAADHQGRIHHDASGAANSPRPSGLPEWASARAGTIKDVAAGLAVPLWTIDEAATPPAPWRYPEMP